ncbi:hypothetical protein [Mucilaginibacter antarcticus]|uniref:hypothetical protein n=1 Tax=Mucilaginibacter antarcticus TaxID=1855725 RepID=UPI00362CF402
MKKKIIILLIAFLTVGINANSYDVIALKRSVTTQAEASDTEAIAMLKAFYTDYITAVAGSDLKKPNVVLSKYCTPSLLKKLKAVDEDQILKVQDANIKMLDKLTIKKQKNDKLLHRTLGIFGIQCHNKCVGSKAEWRV